MHNCTDSQIVLHWVHKGAHSKPFIDNHVQEISEAFPSVSLSFTPLADNPADLLTREISMSQLRASHLWAQTWLLTKSNWPTWTPTTVLLLQAEEESEPCRDRPSSADSQTGIKTNGSVSCGPRSPGRAQTGVSILTGTTKLRFSRIHISVTFYLKITKFVVELPAYKGRLDSKIEVNHARHFRDTRDQSFSFCSSFFFFSVFSHKPQNRF